MLARKWFNFWLIRTGLKHLAKLFDKLMVVGLLAFYLLHEHACGETPGISCYLNDFREPFNIPKQCEQMKSRSRIGFWFMANASQRQYDLLAIPALLSFQYTRIQQSHVVFRLSTYDIKAIGSWLKFRSTRDKAHESSPNSTSWHLKANLYSK